MKVPSVVRTDEAKVNFKVREIKFVRSMLITVLTLNTIRRAEEAMELTVEHILECI